MSEQLIRIKSVNVNRSNGRMHGILQTNDQSYDIILIQEPWFDGVATLRSDTNPNGIVQSGFPANNKWITLSPTRSADDHLKVCAYINRRTINQTHIVNHIPPSPLTSANTMVIDILSPVSDKIELHIINIYHDKPASGHALTHLFSHLLDDSIPTLVMGDLNTHSPRWSLPHSTPSSWAPAFHEWMDTNGLETLNPINQLTWKRPGSKPSIIDLALANESARYFANLSALTVSWDQSKGSDHAALLINFYPEERQPPPREELRGFYIDPAKQEDWTNTFRSLADDRSLLTMTDPADASAQLHEVIMMACQRHLDKIKPGPLKGAVWWNEDCAAKLQSLRSSRAGIERKEASKVFSNTVQEAKRSWAHQQLFENAKTENIWNMARVRKGRRAQVLPPLKDTNGTTHSDTDVKATLLKARFFPPKSNSVDITIAATQDPDPLTTRPWTPIDAAEIAEALKDTSNKSAPGPSGINYKLLKWTNAAYPEVITHLFNLSLSTGTHV